MANSAVRLANLLAFSTSTLPPNPSGRLLVRSVLHVACSSERLADENVWHGGAACHHVTAPRSIMPKIFSKTVSIARFALASGPVRHERCSTSSPHIRRTADVSPALPWNSSKKDGLDLCPELGTWGPGITDEELELGEHGVNNEEVEPATGVGFDNAGPNLLDME